MLNASITTPRIAAAPARPASSWMTRMAIAGALVGPRRASNANATTTAASNTPNPGKPTGGILANELRDQVRPHHDAHERVRSAAFTQEQWQDRQHRADAGADQEDGANHAPERAPARPSIRHDRRWPRSPPATSGRAARVPRPARSPA